MRVIYNSWLPFRGYKAMTVGPWVLCRRGTVLTERDLRHEAIHWEQQKELLVAGFLLWYAVEFLVRLCLTRKWRAAYRAVCFEREAYSFECVCGYEQERHRYYWRHLL